MGHRRRPVPAELRRRAEEILAGRQGHEKGEADALQLLHELQVHGIELELQKDELVATRHEAELGLQRYTELFDFAPIGYFVIDRAGTIREVNLAGARLLGVERGRLVGMPFGQFVSEDQLKAFRGLLTLVLSGNSEDEEGQSCELNVRGEGGKPRQVQLTAAALQGDRPVALCAAQDITERRQAEAALREEGRRKDDFLAALSHELRNPLAPIRNSLAILSRAEPGGERARNAQAVIDRQVTHLTRIVDDLLDATRIARAKIRLQLERLDLASVVARSMEDHRQTFEKQGISFEARLGSEPLWVDGDTTRLAQVLSNLLSNAAKFTTRGGKVEVSLLRNGAEAVLKVRDSGIGFDAEMLRRLFDPFAQAPQSLDRSLGGLGLGLALVKGLVVLHGGTVAATSAGSGQGAEFSVTLPLAAEPPGAQALVATPQTPRHRILVIDDNEDAADSLRTMLVLSGHDVWVAHDGPSGVALAKKCRPEIIVCDIGLPGVDGYQVARAIREDTDLRSTYLVMLSGYGRPDDLQRGLQAGFDAHVVKPGSLEEFERVFALVPA